MLSIYSKSGTCPVCKQTVSITHPMQTLNKQMQNHLRTHGLKGRELRKVLSQAY